MNKLCHSSTTDYLFTVAKVSKIRSLYSENLSLCFVNIMSVFHRGLDFRPEYRKVTTLVSVFSDCPCLLLTATATPKIQNDLYNVLSLFDNTKVVALLPDR